MGAAGNQFRSASFGGFNRQDVIAYVSRTEVEYEQTLAQLREELDRVQREASDKGTRNTSMESELQSAQDESASLQAALERAAHERDRAKSELALREEELTALRRELAELAPKAISYERLKTRKASIELDAHARAQATIDEARQEANKLRQECAREIREAQVKYELLCTGLGEAIAKSTVEIEQIRCLFHRVNKDLGGYEGTLQTLLERAEEMAQCDELEGGVTTL